MIPILASLLLQSGSLGPAGAPDVPRVVTAARVAPASRPVLDGRLDDAAWTLATPIGGLMQRDPQEGAAATEQVDVRILYDAEAVYIGALFNLFVRLADTFGIEPPAMYEPSGIPPALVKAD